MEKEQRDTAREKRIERGKKYKVIYLPECPSCHEKDCEGRISFELKEKKPNTPG